MKKFWLPVVLLLLVVITSFRIAESSKKKKDPVKTHNNENLTGAVLWYQLSGEMRALYFQGYNVARYNLDNYLKYSLSDKKKCVVVDIDETILNNSPYEGKIILNDAGFDTITWRGWIELAQADTLPGAYSFLKYAESRGVETFYISNRKLNEVPATIKNLKKFGLPYADEKHTIFKSTTSSKEERRQSLLKEYDIVILCGDNLGDFDIAFENRNPKAHIDSVNKYSVEFGKRFIVLPNPMYGDWEKPIYTSKNFTEAQRDSARKSLLKAY